MSYDYTALPVSNTFTPNFAEGGGINEMINPYLDPSFKFKNVSGPPKVETLTDLPELKLAAGGRTTPEEFYQQYMQQGRNPTDLKYGVRGYPNTAPTVPKTPYERAEPTPADIVGVDGETYTWDPVLGKYVAKPKINKIPTPETNIGIGNTFQGAGDATGQQQAKINAMFDNMNPQQKADHQAQLAILDKAMVPVAVKIAQDILPALKPKDPNEAPAPVVNMDTLSPAAQAESNAFTTPVTPQTAVTSNALAPAPVAVTSPVTSQTTLSPTALSPAPVAVTSPVAPQTTLSPTALSPVDGDTFAPMNLNQIATLSESVSTSPGNAGSAVGASSGIGGMGTGHAGVTASGGNASNAAAAAVGAANAAAANAGKGSGAGSSGSSGSSGTSSSGMGGMGTGAAGAAASAAAGGGGGGGGGGGCCFIMLEARYGNGTMDRVVRRYRDEKVTERNKRGYYKLAEVFIPLMRKSKLFSFFVVKTFADPAVCYAKWYYGENKWGWVFKPLEKFWMGLFDTLGTETKFIRENGEVV
jgi:hypothetical protein